MRHLKVKLKIIGLYILVICLSGFTNFTEKVPAPKDVPKRSENVDAGIVIPSFDCTPYDVIKNSYDPLSAFMYDPEEGIFVTLSTSNFDFKPHKLTFYHKKFGFVTKNAYRVRISYFEKTKDQKMSNFSFCPFEMSSPVSATEVKVIAESWTKFFDSLGWKRAVQTTQLPYGTLPKDGSWPYMVWLTDGFRLSVNIAINDIASKPSLAPNYYIKITFSNK